MRLLAVLWCSMVLLATTLAQNPPPPSSSDTGQPQQPQNPLQTQPATQPEQPPKPSASTFELGNAAGSGQDQELGEVRLMTRYTQLNGDTTKSFYVPGENDLAEFNYFYDHGFLGTRRLQFLTMFRATDDKSIDPEHNSLQKGFLRIYGPRDEYIIGDTLVNFSLLSFNQNIRGADTSWKLGDSWKLTTVGGVFIDRWGSIWNYNILGRPYLATVAGSRLEYKPNKRATLGFNFSYSKDNVGTLPPAVLGTPPEPAENKVGSVDLKLQFPWGLRMNAEYAYSFTDFDLRPGVLPCLSNVPPCDTRMPEPGIGTQGDWGGRAEATYRWHKLTLRGSFVRYEPNFASMNARQINDLQDGIFRATYDLTHFLTLDGTVRRSNNNLRGQLTTPTPGCVATLGLVPCTPTGYETVLWGPEMHFILHDLGFYRRAALEFGYRDREVRGTRPTPATCIANEPATTTCLSQFVRMPFAELTAPYHRTYATLGYELRHMVDNTDPTQSAQIHRVYAALRGLYELGGWHINPNFRFELERQGHVSPCISGVPNSNCFLLADRLTQCDPTNLSSTCYLQAYDSNRLDTAAILVEAPRWFIMEAGYRATTATIYGPSGYNRPSYRAALTYKLRNDENTVFIFSFYRANYFYLTPANLTPITDYDERQFGMSFVYKFGKRR